jgi:hypothetical protein
MTRCVDRQKKSLVGTNYIVVLGDTPRVATGISTNFKDKFESRN